MNIIIGSGKSMGWLKYILWNSIQRKDVLFFQDISDMVLSPILRGLCKISKKSIIRKYSSNFEKHFYDLYVYEEKEKIEHIVFTAWNFIALDSDYLRRIRKSHPQTKLVYLLTGSYNISSLFFEKANITIADLKNKFDVICTFSKDDAIEYDLLYIPLLYNFGFQDKCDVKYDLCYVGNAKDRLDLLHEIYRELSNDFSLDFHIMNVPIEQKKYKGISYNIPISYEDSIRISARSKVILEVLEEKQTFSTIRYAEAILLNKRFITNNVAINEDSLYEEKYVYCLGQNWKDGVRKFLRLNEPNDIHPQINILKQREFFKILEEAGW